MNYATILARYSVDAQYRTRCNEQKADETMIKKWEFLARGPQRCHTKTSADHPGGDPIKSNNHPDLPKVKTVVQRQCVAAKLFIKKHFVNKRMAQIELEHDPTR